MAKTVVKAFQLLEALGEREEPCGIADLSKELKLGKSNVHRLVNTLVKLGYAKPVGMGRYTATLKTWELGALVLSRLNLKDVAAPHLQSLSQETGETVQLSILDKFDVVFIDKVEGAQPVRAYSQVGARAPAFAVATGKVLLSFRGVSSAAEIGQLTAFTEQTITSHRRLRKQLDQVRQLGFATSRDEWREGVSGVAAPIRGPEGEVLAAVGLSGPSERLKPMVLKKLSAVVCRTALKISHDLGFRPYDAVRGRHAR